MEDTIVAHLPHLDEYVDHFCHIYCKGIIATINFLMRSVIFQRRMLMY